MGSPGLQVVKRAVSELKSSSGWWQRKQQAVMGANSCRETHHSETDSCQNKKKGGKIERKWLKLCNQKTN